MGLAYNVYLNSDRIFGCKSCKAHLATYEAIISRQCHDTVGWKYDKAYETSEKYKEGKFILEAELLCMVQ